MNLLNRKKPKNSYSINYLDNCRICESNNLTRFLHFPLMPMTDNFLPWAMKGTEFLDDIDIYVCQECWVVQTLKDVDVSDYYENYQYSVGNSNFTSNFNKYLADKIIDKFFEFGEGLNVLEIGSGDGNLLKAFQSHGCKTLGYEPSSNLCETAERNNINTVQGIFTRGSKRNIPKSFGEADIIALSYTFDHVPNPLSVLKEIRSLINIEEGILVIETHDLELILSRREFCLFEHEHSIYLTQETISKILDMAGFEVIDFNFVPKSIKRGNSLITLAKPKNSRPKSHIIQYSSHKSYNEISFYKKKEKEFSQSILNLNQYALKSIDQGKKIAGYGAGGRGIMTLAAMENVEAFKYLVDMNPKHQGFLSPKSGLQVFMPEKLLHDPVDEIVVFSFGYFEEIVETVKQYGYGRKQLISVLDLLSGRKQCK